MITDKLSQTFFKFITKYFSQSVFQIPKTDLNKSVLISQTKEYSSYVLLASFLKSKIGINRKVSAFLQFHFQGMKLFWVRKEEFIFSFSRSLYFALLFWTFRSFGKQNSRNFFITRWRVQNATTTAKSFYSKSEFNS